MKVVGRNFIHHGAIAQAVGKPQRRSRHSKRAIQSQSLFPQSAEQAGVSKVDDRKSVSA
ncbi:MAG: hypothetical protein GDYSWBUE_001998 [Candidatus Fervidibacterota bacterium]